MNNWTKTLIAAAMSVSSFSAATAPVELDRALTVVNDGVVLASDVKRLKNTVIRTTDPASLPPMDVLEQQIIEQLILEELQLQEGKRLGIKISDSQLDQAINAIAREKKMTPQMIRQELAAQGISWADYREQIRKEITISETRNALVRRRISVLPQEIDALAKQLNTQTRQQVKYCISQIQLRVDEDASKTERDAVAAQAQLLLTELKQGKDFTKLALAKSKGPRALKGGNWGCLRLEEMPTIFADQIKDNGVGAIIGPFRSGVGYHLLRINSIEGIPEVKVTEVNARHILIKPSIILSDAGAKKQLAQLANRINRGEISFADAAKQFSADPGSAVKGGELGWQPTEIYVPQFKKVADTLPKGRISQPFKTDHGWHIVEVLDRRQSDRTDAAIQNRAYQMLLNRKFNEETQAWLQELRAGAYVEPLENINANN